MTRTNCRAKGKAGNGAKQATGRPTSAETHARIVANIAALRASGKHEHADAVEEAMMDALRKRGERFELGSGGQNEEAPESRTVTN
jgi:isocitrate dehydrogenase